MTDDDSFELYFVPTVLISQNDSNGITTLFPDDMDARNIKYDAEAFDLALTSSPYANAVDYPRTHQADWILVLKK